MRMSAPLFIAAIFSVCFATAAHATDRFFCDIIVLSPDGRWRLELRSPDNAKKDAGHVAFQSNFTYTLFDAGTRQELWRHRQGKDEGSPVDAWVNNDKWVVIRTGWDQLLVFDPAGTQTFSCDLLEKCFSKEEHKKYVQETTAGPHWAGRSYWHFFDVSGSPHFGVRAWWGKRVVIDLAKGRLAEISESVLKSAEKSETAYVIQSLNLGVKALKKLGEKADEKWNKLEGGLIWDVLTAAHIAGKMRIKEAVPLLVELQVSEYSGRCGGRHEDDLKAGEVGPFDAWDLTLRRSVHAALRRLGETPMDLPGFKFRLEKTKGLGPFVPEKKFALPRAERIAKIKPGMTPLQVLNSMGAPDALAGDAEAWDFDIDGEKPFTFRVTWKKRKVSKCERLEPPIWTGEERDFDLAY